MVAVAGVLELVLIASQGNHHRRHGHYSGPWAVRMAHSASHTVSWAVVVLIGIAFVSVWAAVRIWWMLGIILASTLIELLWEHDLPRPQNQWGYAVAFLVGAFAMFAQAVSRTNFVADARARLRSIGINI
jgi:hypothetical protein